MKKNTLSKLIIITLIFSIFLPITSMADDNTLKVSRIAGKDRIETSVEVSKKLFENSEYAIIASGENFVDGLVGGTLASQLKAPILLVTKNSVSKSVIDEINRLEVKKIYILGGAETISEEVENKIKNTGINVKRLSGKNGTYTAQEIGLERGRFLNIDLYSAFDKYVAVYSEKFADALSAAPYVASMNEFMPLLPIGYGYKDSHFTIAIGGTNSVIQGNYEEYRLSGQNREATAVAVAKAYKEKLNKDIDTIVLVDGYNYSDALASSPVATMNSGGILLTNSKMLSKETNDYIKENKNIKNIIIVGGENSVSIEIENELKYLNVENEK